MSYCFLFIFFKHRFYCHHICAEGGVDQRIQPWHKPQSCFTHTKKRRHNPAIAHRWCQQWSAEACRQTHTVKSSATSRDLHQHQWRKSLTSGEKVLNCLYFRHLRIFSPSSPKKECCIKVLVSHLHFWVYIYINSRGRTARSLAAGGGCRDLHPGSPLVSSAYQYGL